MEGTITASSTTDGDAPITKSKKNNRRHHRCCLRSDTLRSLSQPAPYKIRRIAKMVSAWAEPAINKTDTKVE